MTGPTRPRGLRRARRASGYAGPLLGTLLLSACGPQPEPEPEPGQETEGSTEVTMVARAPCSEDVEGLAACALRDTSEPNDHLGTAGSFEVVARTIDHPDRAVAEPVTVLLPGNAGRAPVIFFAPDVGAEHVALYRFLMERLASQGYVVAFLPHGLPTRGRRERRPNARRYDQMFTGIRLVAEGLRDRVDMTRAGYVGHGFGAGAIPELALRGLPRTWGSERLFLFAMAPLYSWGHDYGRLPDQTKVVVQVYWDDQVADHRIAVDEIWNQLPRSVERIWQVVRPSHCRCVLPAGHDLPQAGTEAATAAGGEDGAAAEGQPPAPDGYDVWVVARRIQALAQYSLAREEMQRLTARPVVLGDNPTSGRFIDGPDLAPVECLTQPSVNEDQEAEHTEAARCEAADRGAPGC